LATLLFYALCIAVAAVILSVTFLAGLPGAALMAIAIAIAFVWVLVEKDSDD
jgi:hypothetical protein